MEKDHQKKNEGSENKLSFLYILSGNKNKASSRVRAYWIIKQLKQIGYRSSALDNHGLRSLVLAFFKIPFYRVIVFQKTYSKYHVHLLQWANILRKTTVLDIDDAPSRIGSEVTLNNFKIMVNRADLVTAGSSALLSYVKGLGAQKAVLIPSAIDLELYSNNKVDNEIFTLGWIGNGKDYQDDLIQIIKPVLEELGKTLELKFLLIGVNGSSALYDEFVGIQNVSVEFIDSLNWADTATVAGYISKMDLGLYPLLPNEFNRYKCAFKALEYMASGVPVVSSDIAFNTEVIQHNVDGFIVKDQKEWIDTIESILHGQVDLTTIRNNGLLKIKDLYNTKLATELLLGELK